jgi:hypothetical protein
MGVAISSFLRVGYTRHMADTTAIRERCAAVGRSLNGRTLRWFVAVEAQTAGHAGIMASSRATGLARITTCPRPEDSNEPTPLPGLKC